MSSSLSDESKLFIRIVCTILGVILCFALFCLILVNSGRSANELRVLLKNSTWEMTKSVDGQEYKLELIFEKDELTYKADVNDEELIFAELPYKLTSGSEILVGPYTDGVEKSFKLEFDDSETIMTMTPAITDTNGIDTWYLKSKD